MKNRLVLCLAVFGSTATLASAAIAVAQEPAPAAPVEDVAGNGTGPAQRAAPERATIKLYSRDLRGGRVTVGERVNAKGRLRPFVPGQRVIVTLRKGKKAIREVEPKVRRAEGGEAGVFSFKAGRLIEPGSYQIRARKPATGAQDAASERTKRFGIHYPDLDPGDGGALVRLLNDLLDQQAYYTASGSGYGSATERAVLAFRKVNNMARTNNATPGILRQLAAGKGGFKLKAPGMGKHVETDLSRQVMVLAKKGKAQHIFHISSGAPSTPTILGKFPTYRKDPGTNSLGMIDSVYFIRGYATHGYHSVPNYPASHGCLRNPPPNSSFIYNWIDMGDVFYVYR